MRDEAGGGRLEAWDRKRAIIESATVVAILDWKIKSQPFK
jgi:hypothetical protein